VAGRGTVASNPVNTAANSFGVLGVSRVDMAPGSLAATGNPLDLAVAGKGFFVVQSASGSLDTRNGGFHRTPDGQLMTAQGDAVLAGRVPSVCQTGWSTSARMERFRWMARWSPSWALRATHSTGPKVRHCRPAASSIQQGMLEQSNVSAVEGMVELITVQRNAEMMQRAISLFDSQRPTTPPKTPRPRFPDLTPKTAHHSSWGRAPHFPKALPIRADKKVSETEQNDPLHLSVQKREPF